MANSPLTTKWNACIDTIKDRINNRGLWTAIEHTVAITVEDGQLVLGIASENFSSVSVIQHSATLHAMSNIVEDAFGERLLIKIIDGTSYADWETYKETQVRAEQIRKTALTPRQSAPTGTAGSWDTVYEQLSRLFANTPLRSMPQGKARYANEALYLLLDSMDTLYTDTPDDSAERSLARMLERISSACEIPAPVLAFELERLRAWRTAPAE